MKNFDWGDISNLAFIAATILNFGLTLPASITPIGREFFPNADSIGYTIKSYFFKLFFTQNCVTSQIDFFADFRLLGILLNHNASHIVMRSNQYQKIR